MLGLVNALWRNGQEVLRNSGNVMKRTSWGICCALSKSTTAAGGSYATFKLIAQFWYIFCPNICSVDSRSNGSAYNKNLTLTTFLYIPLGCFSLFLYNGYNNISLQQQISAGPLKNVRAGVNCSRYGCRRCCYSSWCCHCHQPFFRRQQ